MKNITEKKSKTTTDHEKIRQWAEKRGGHPATVKRTRGQRGSNNVGLLRIDFPGFSGGRSLEEISWDEFFEQFDQSNLAFLYQERTAGGKTSRFNKLVDRSRATESRPIARKKT